MTTNPSLIEHLKKIEHSTALIRKQIQFARDYQNIGLNPPQWQNVDETIRRATKDLDRAGVLREKEMETLEIYADLLLERVFFNVVDNALRHGQKETKIRFSAQEIPEGLVIFCQDDGVGIPENMKEGVFKCDYFHNKGYGLFLASEILSMTGLSVSETGRPGSGARIEIRVPRGSYRFIIKRDEG
jgi:K+-sensing histidine kinase KdpD